MYPITFIQPDVLYTLSGTSSDISYNGLTYSPGDNFRGVFGSTAFSPIDSAVYELTEIRAGGIEFATNAVDAPASFPETTQISGMAVEFSLNPEEEIVNDVTKITGFSIEFLYYSPYVFQISKYVTPPSNAGINTSTTTTTTTGPQYTLTSQSFTYGTYSTPPADGMSLNLYDLNNNNQFSTTVTIGKTLNTPYPFTFDQSLAPFSIKVQGNDVNGDGIYTPVDIYLNGTLLQSNVGVDNSIVTIATNVSSDMVLEFLNVGESYSSRSIGMLYFTNQSNGRDNETFVMKIMDSSSNVLLTQTITPVLNINGVNYEGLSLIAFEELPVGSATVGIFTTGGTYSGNFSVALNGSYNYYTPYLISDVNGLSVPVPTSSQQVVIGAGF